MTLRISIILSKQRRLPTSEWVLAASSIALTANEAKAN